MDDGSTDRENKAAPAVSLNVAHYPAHLLEAKGLADDRGAFCFL